MRGVFAALVLALCKPAYASSSRESFFEFFQPDQRFSFADFLPERRQANDYICQFPFNPENAWVPEELAIAVRVGGGMVSDGIIAKYHVGSRPINVRQRGAGDLVALWSVRNARDSRGKLTNFLLFELNLNRNTGAAKLFVRPEQYANKFRGQGTCRLRGE